MDKSFDLSEAHIGYNSVFDYPIENNSHGYLKSSQKDSIASTLVTKKTRGRGLVSPGVFGNSEGIGESPFGCVNRRKGSQVSLSLHQREKRSCSVEIGIDDKSVSGSLMFADSDRRFSLKECVSSENRQYRNKRTVFLKRFNSFVLEKKKGIKKAGSKKVKRKRKCSCYKLGKKLCYCHENRELFLDTKLLKKPVINKKPCTQEKFTCGCRKSKCQKSYCQCYANGGKCNANCACLDCGNK